MSGIVRHARHTMRSLRRAPGFALAVLLALAVGIGLGIPVFGIVRASLLRSSPYTDPLLREGGQATGWLSGWTSEHRTIAQIQSEGLDALLWILSGLTVLLLGIALVNIVTLLLARAAVRRPEIALRAVLGAVPRRLVGHLLAEGALLVLLGGGLGLLIGVGGGVLLHRSWPGEAPPWGDLVVDGWVLAVVVGVFTLAPLLAWVSPAGVAWRRDLRRFLTTGGRSTAGRGEAFTRQTLAVVQIAASLILLTSAALLVRAFASSPVESRVLGFDPRDTLVVQVRLPESRILSSRERYLLYQTARHRIAALPGVVDTSVATPGTWLGLGTTDRVLAICPECVQGSMIKPTSEAPARIHAVSPGFFAALGASLLRGREFGFEDRPGAPSVAVINDTFAHRLFPRGEPIGKQIQVGGREGEWYTVVGVVGDIRAPGIGTGAEPVPALYLSTLQHPPTVVNLAVRTTGDSMRLAPAVEAAVRALDPNVTLLNAMTMEEYLARFRAPLRWFAVLFAVLATAALLLAASGLHGVMSYNVARRTREIGIRMALGARSRDVTHMILGQSLRITGIGAVLGLIGAVGVARLLQLLMSGVEPLDPLVFGGIAVLLGSVGLLASYRPARRAAEVDPQISLREE